MGNEMGNNNTSGLREEDNTAQENSLQEVAHADDLKGQNHVVSATQDKDSRGKKTGLASGDVGREDPNSDDDQKTDDKEEDDMRTEVKKSMQDAIRTDDDKGQNHEVLASEDVYVNEKETGLVSITPERVAAAELHNDNQKHDEKEQDYNMIPEETVKSLQEGAYADGAKGQDHLVSATDDKNTQGNETELVSTEPDGIASPNVDKQKQDEKELDISRKAEEIPLQEAVSTVETKEEAHIAPAAEDKSTQENETELVSSEPDGIPSPNFEKQKQNENEKHHRTKEEEIPLKEAASTVETKEEAHIVPAAEEKNSHENETELVSSEPHGIASPNFDKQKQNENEQDNSTKAEEIPLHEATSTVETKEEARIVPAAEDKVTHQNETELVSSEPDGIASPNVYKQKQDVKELDNSTKAEEIPLQEAVSTVETTEDARIVPAAEDKNTHENETELVSSESDGIVSPNVDKQNQDEKELDNSTKAEEIPLQEAVSTVETTEDARIVPAAEDKNTHENETELVSSESDGIVSPNVDKQNQDEKELDNSTKAEEIPLQEAVSTVETKEEAHIVPAAEDKNTHENETQLVSGEPDGIASRNVEKQKQHEKEKDNSTKAEEKSLQEAATTVETKAEADIAPAAGDKNTQGIETSLVSSDHDGMTYPCVDNQKQDEKEEDININDEAKEKFSQEAASTNVGERQDHLLPALEDKSTHGNETGLVSSDPEGTNPHTDKRKQHEKEEGNTDAEPLPKDDHADDIEEKNLTIPVSEGEGCNNTEAEAEIGSGDPLVVGDTLDNQTKEGQEQGRTELHIPDESRKAEEKASEAFDEGRETQPTSSSQNLEDHEMQKESSFMENLSRSSFHFENQNSMMKEDEGAGNSISDAASSTSHDSVTQEPAVLEPEEHELAKIQNEQVVQVCNGPLKSENMITPSLTCQPQENGFILDSSMSSDMKEEKERDDFLVKEMATKEVASEDKFELKDGDEASNHLGNITTMMTDLPTGVSAKCNGEFPSEMNSIRNDSPESQIEAYLSDETLNLLVEVSQTEEEGVVHTLVRNESENRNCKYQSGEESIEKSDGRGSEEGSNADKQNASPPQSTMNGCQNEVKRRPLDVCCDSRSCNKDCQFEAAKIIENGHLVDASIDYQNEATGEQQKDTQIVHLVTDPAVISADIFPSDKIYKEEDSEEEKMVETLEDSNPIGNDTSRRENEGQCMSLSYPTEQAENVLSTSLFLHAWTEKQQKDSYMQCKKVQNINESMAELKHESSGEFSTTEASSFVTQNLTVENVVSLVEFAGQKPLWDLSERPEPTAVTMAETKPSLKQSGEQCAINETPAIAESDYYQRETVGRFSSGSNSDNTSIHAQMRKSPSFDLDLRIDARAEESDQTPLLYQDKTTIESFSSQADVTDPGKPAANSEYGAMPVEEKVVKLKRSDSEKSKTPFPSFLKEEEEADQNQMLITPKKQDNQSAAKKATKVSTKGKEKRKPRTSLFGTCMCCATVIN